MFLYFQTFLKYIAFGDSIRIDASSLCQLSCPICQVWNLKEKAGIGYLKFDDYKKFILSHPNFKNIELSNNGEIFLNPDIDKIIRFSFENGVNLSAVNGVNLNNISDETIELLVKCRFGPISVSIDGASEETYRVYRRGGNFEKVISNIKKINAYKHKNQSTFPHMTWRFIVFGHNEHEIGIARRMAHELGMNFCLLTNVAPNYSPVLDMQHVSTEMGFASIEEWQKSLSANGQANLSICKQLWESPQINWDGRLFACCCNSRPFAANVFELGLFKGLKHEQVQYAKNMLCGKAVAREDIPCSKCATYKYRLDRQMFINEGNMFFSAKWNRFKNYLNDKINR